MYIFDINNILVILNSIISFIMALCGYLFWDKLKKQKEIGISLSIEQLKNKLRLFYYPIYFRLIRLNYSKYQLNYMKKIFDNDDMIKIEEDIVLNIHKELINIISENHYLLDNDDNINEYILEYFNHAILYMNLRKFHISKKPSDYGFGFPNEFFSYIKDKTEKLKNEYNEILGYNTNEIKLNNDTNDFIINILNDPNSLFNKNLNDDRTKFFDKKTTNIFLNNSSLNINDIPNLNTVFKNVNLSNIDNK
jgi:hypothetical protein